MKYKACLLGACGVIGIAAASGAAAQDTSGAVMQDVDQVSSDAVESDNAGMIVVTARRREELLQDVPISVSSMSGQQLEEAGITDVQALQYSTPSLSITSAQSQRNTIAFSLRGQRTQETQLFTDPPVGTYFAEVVQPRPYGFGKTFYDLESVQVLKGVQGTLFGRNMTGGAVLVEPAHPKIGEFSGEVKGQYGNYNMYDIYGMVNIPVGDSFAIRIAGKTHERDGWAREVTTNRRYDDQNFDTFRVSALFEPNDMISSLTIFDFYESKEAGTASFITDISTPSLINIYERLRGFGLIDTNIPAQFAEAQQLFRQNRFTFNSGSGEGGNLDFFGAPYEDIQNWGITNKTTIELSDSLTLKNIFGYRKQRRDIVQDYDGIAAFLIAPYQFARTENISEELQLQGQAFDDRLDFIVGAFYFQEEGLDGSIANTLPELNIIGAGLNARTTSAELFLTTNPGEGYARTAAAFVAGTFELTDQLSLSGGLRYNYDKRKITVSPAFPNRPDGMGGIGVCNFDTDAATAGIQTVPLDQCSFTNSTSFKEFTYDATVQYEPSDAVTLYASYRRGFRAGGFSTRATSFVSLEPFLPEFVDEYEVGMKTSTGLGAGRLTSSLALFRQDASDVQKQRATFVGGNVFTIVDNTAKQRNQGGEVEATFATEGFTLTGFYSYTDVDILAGRVTLNGRPEFENRGVPKHQAGFTATMSPPLDESVGNLDFILNYSWRSENFLDDFELEGRQPAFSLVNARVQLTEIAESGASLAFFVNNALNETYRIGTLGLIAEGLGFSASVYGEPRMFGVELGYKF